MEVDADQSSTAGSSSGRSALLKARVGQGWCRARLMALWNGRCALTGCSLREVLMAPTQKHGPSEKQILVQLQLHLGVSREALSDAFQECNYAVGQALAIPESLGYVSDLRQLPAANCFQGIQASKRTFSVKKK